MTRALATVLALAGLAAAFPGASQAGTPVPWCGTPSSVDRLPDAALGYAIHVLYVRPAGAPDRFAEWAPRIAGDVAEIEAWWRGQDPTRSPRFDLFAAPGCAGSFGALDITSLEAGIDSAETGLGDLATVLIERGFRAREKTYLLYYDGPTGQDGDSRICGIGASAFRSTPGFALVYLEPCGADVDDDVRVQTAAHELVHALGAVPSAAPNECPGREGSGHVCDHPLDLMVMRVTGEPLSAHLLDANRDDYYGHSGTWPDLQDSFFLERLDGPDRTPPTAPGNVRVSEGVGGFAHLMWRPSSDDVGPVEYWLYQSGFLVDRLTETITTTVFAGRTTEFGVRAVDASGRLSPIVVVRFRRGVGMVDASGRLVRDTVSPPAVGPVTIRRTGKTATLAWPAVRDAGGIASYRVLLGSRTVTVRRPRITVTRARVTADIVIVAVDRAGNVGLERVVARSRVR